MTTTTGWQQAQGADKKGEALTSAVFAIETPNGTAMFSELGGISSEVEQQEYMEAGEKGPMFGRFIGKAKPPTVTLKRAMANNSDTTWIWEWHAAARTGAISAYRHCSLKLYGAAQGMSKPVKTYEMVNAFPTKVEIAGMKAGGTEVVMQTVTLQCDEIFEMSP